MDGKIHLETFFSFTENLKKRKEKKKNPPSHHSDDRTQFQQFRIHPSLSPTLCFAHSQTTTSSSSEKETNEIDENQQPNWFLLLSGTAVSFILELAQCIGNLKYYFKLVRCLIFFYQHDFVSNYIRDFTLIYTKEIMFVPSSTGFLLVIIYVSPT